MKRFITWLLVIAFVMTPLVVLASYEYDFPITIIDTSGTTRSILPVVLGFKGQTLIDSGRINSNGLDSNYQDGTTNLLYMISTDNVTAIIPSLVASGKVDTDFYTGYDPEQTGFPIITGVGGSVSIADQTTMEMANNSTMEYYGYLDTTKTGQYIYNKSGAYQIQVSPTTSGSVIFSTGGTSNITLPITSGLQKLRIEKFSRVGTTWLSDWENRMRFIIDHTKVSENLTYFPLQLTLSSTAGINDTDVTAIFDELGVNNLKLAVTKNDGVTQLYVEIVNWDAATKTAQLNVSAAGWAISSTTDTVIYLYYDSSKADNSTYVGVVGSAAGQSVWDTSYLQVDHMEDDPSTSATKDSTSNTRNGTKGAASKPAQTTGISGNAQDFTSANAADKVAYASTSAANTTFELVLKLKSNAFYPIVGLFDLASSHSGLEYRAFNQDRIDFVYNTAFTAYSQRGATTGLNDLGWHYLGYYGSPASLTSSNWTIDATTYARSNYSDAGGTAWSSITLGYGNGSWLNGYIDEFRVSTTYRSAAWRAATYYSIWDNLVNYNGYGGYNNVQYAYEQRVYVDNELISKTASIAVPNVADNITLGSNATPYYYYFMFGKN